MILSGRNLFALIFLLLFSNPIWTQTNAAFFEYPVSSACSGDPAPVFVINLATSGGSFTSTPAGLALDPISGAIGPGASLPGTYQVTHTVSNPTATHSETFTIDEFPLALVSYPFSELCKDGVDSVQTDNFGATPGGTYWSQPAGLMIDPNSGTIFPDISQTGFYTVFYVVGPAPCRDTASFSLALYEVLNYNLDYGQDTFCATGEICPLTQPPSPTGLFRYLPGLAYSNDTMGCIDLSLTSPNREYVIRYVESVGCQTVVQDTIYVQGLDDASFQYPASVYCTSDDTIYPILSGQTGTFSYVGQFVNYVLLLDPNTGAIDPFFSDPGTYQVTHTSSGLCPDTSTFSITFLAAPGPFGITNQNDTLLIVANPFGHSVTWYFNGVQQNFTTDSIVPIGNGVYHAVMTSNFGCDRQSSNAYVGITDQEEGSDLRSLVHIFPNPSNGWFDIRTDLPTGEPVAYSLYDLQGKMLENGTFSPLTGGGIDLSSESAGLYLLQITHRNSSTCFKLIKTQDQ